MICFRDMTFCSDTDQCANKDKCQRYFSITQQDAAKRWWGKDGAPVAFGSFKIMCKDFKEAE